MACVTFFSADSYIHRAKMATRRPVRKGPRPRSDPSQKAGPAREPEERLLVEEAQSDPAKFDALYELHFERVYAFVASRVRDEFPAPDDPPDRAAAPDLQASEMRAIEYRAQLFLLVRRLPEVQKQVVYQRFVEQRSIRDIAQRLGKTEGAVKQLQLRAIQNLRAQLEGSRA